MNKKLVIGAAAGLAVGAAIAAGRKCASGPTPTMWEKMRERMEEMPEDFPPRIMFDNVQATRANTEEILTLLRADSPQDDDVDVMSSG